MSSIVVSLVLNNFKNDSRVLREAHTVAEMGYVVKIVALHEPDLLEYENCENYTVHRIKLWSKHWGKSRLVQLFKYIEFLIRVVLQYRKVDIVHSHDLSALPVGCAIKFISRRHVKLVYDAHEYAINDLPYESKIRQRIKKCIESIFIYWVDWVITVSDGIADLYQKTYSLRSRPSVILNCPALVQAPSSNMLKQKLGISKDTYLFLYQGALSRGRGIQQFIDGFNKVDNRDLALVFMGYGELIPLIESQSTDNIFLMPAVTPSELPYYTASADCGVALIEDSCLSYRHCLPNKMFEYFMAGLPVIASDLPEMRKIINEYDTGVLCSSGETSDIEHAIQTIRYIDKDQLAINLNRLNTTFNWTNQEKILKRVYETL